MVLHSFITSNLKRICTQGFMKLIIPMVLPRTLLAQTGIYFIINMAEENTMSCSTVCGYCFNSCCTASSFSYHCFDILGAIFTVTKKANTHKNYHRQGFGLWPFRRVLHHHPKPHTLQTPRLQACDTGMSSMKEVRNKCDLSRKFRN